MLSADSQYQLLFLTDLLRTLVVNHLVTGNKYQWGNNCDTIAALSINWMSVCSVSITLHLHLLCRLLLHQLCSLSLAVYSHHCYFSFSTITWENNPSSCFGCPMAEAFLCRNIRPCCLNFLKNKTLLNTAVRLFVNEDPLPGNMAHTTTTHTHNIDTDTTTDTRTYQWCWKKSNQKRYLLFVMGAEQNLTPFFIVSLSSIFLKTFFSILFIISLSLSLPHCFSLCHYLFPTSLCPSLSQHLFTELGRCRSFSIFSPAATTHRGPRHMAEWSWYQFKWLDRKDCVYVCVCV